MALFSKKRLKNKVVNQGEFKNLGNIVDAVNAIFNSSNYNGANIFESITRSIQKVTGAKIIIIGKYIPQNEQIKTLAFWDKNDIKSNYNYNLKNTPCSTILGKQPCSYPANVSKMFPLDKGLVERGIEAYVGIPLFYSEQRPMGLLAVMFDVELDDYLIVESILRIYGIRVGSEMEHLEYHSLLENQNIELNSLFSELKKKNAELDRYVVEVKEAHSRAEESNQLKTAFLANLSHEVRTPMNVMLGFAELLKTESLSHDERVEFIDIINQNGAQLLKIMDNLIDISKFQSKKLVDNPKPLNLNALLDRSFQSYLDYIRVVQKPLRLFLEKGMSDMDDQILVDQEGLSKVLDQLLDNAVKFTSSGWIKFGYEVLDREILFYVKDTGVGIPEGMEEKIFDMFRQVDIDNSREFGGNGLGLAIARRYVEILGGKLWTKKEADCSASFYFKIPLILTGDN